MDPKLDTFVGQQATAGKAERQPARCLAAPAVLVPIHPHVVPNRKPKGAGGTQRQADVVPSSPIVHIRQMGSSAGEGNYPLPSYVPFCMPAN